jgi:cytochrome c-type biogenesis protein CcmH
MIRALMFLLLLAGPVAAVEPDEMLADPVLEARARELSKELRCLICRNETIDDSHATIARDLRLLLRERIAAGDTDAQAVAFIVDRFGEYVLLNPTSQGGNMILWLAGPGLLVFGGIVAVGYMRRRGRMQEFVDELTDGEQVRLKELMKR